MRRALPGAPLRVINFDWHGAVKELREKGAVEGLWALLETLVSQVGFFVLLLRAPLAETPASGMPRPELPQSSMHIEKKLLGCAAG